LIYSLAGLLLLGVAGFFIYQALASSLVYFIVPSEYAAAPEKYEGRIRLGALYRLKHQLRRRGTRANFNVTDSLQTYPVRYSGAPPELFKEDTGVVVVGHFKTGRLSATRF
jgi:cytochrome c-type biogenesis protein CcmE